jgi:hypothetical protein
VPRARRSRPRRAVHRTASGARPGLERGDQSNVCELHLRNPNERQPADLSFSPPFQTNIGLDRDLPRASLSRGIVAMFATAFHEHSGKAKRHAGWRRDYPLSFQDAANTDVRRKIFNRLDALVQ